MADKKETKKIEAKPEEKVEKKAKATTKVEKKPVVKKVDVTNVSLKQLMEMEKEYTLYRFNIKLGQESNTAKLRNMRRDIARAKMYINNKNSKQS